MTATTAPLPTRPTRRRLAPRMGWAAALSPTNIGVAYLGVLIFVYFSIRIPDLFLTEATIKSVFTEESLGAIVALAFLIPLAAGQLDLSIGPNLAASAIVIAWAVTEQEMPPVLAIILGLLFAIGVGIVNGILVVRFRVQAFIATLAMTSMLVGFATFVTSDNDIPVAATSGIRDIARGDWFGINRTIYYLFAIAVILWFVLEHTPVGRYLFATGGGPEAARLAGVQTNRYIFGSFVASGFLAGVCGVLSVSRIGVGSPNIGPGFLLPAAAAAFVGATQFKRGQINVWGTILATFVLAFGVKGLLLQQWDEYVDDLFNGLALAIAVAVSQYQRRARVAEDVTTGAELEDVPPTTPWVSQVRPVLEGLAKETGETVHLAVLEGDRVAFLDCVESQAPLRVVSRTGTTEPAELTAVGKAMLAELPEDEWPGRYSDAVKGEIAHVRARGYATGHEPSTDVASLAVAFRSGEHRAPAAISIAAPTSRMTDDVAASMVAALERAVRELDDSSLVAS